MTANATPEVAFKDLFFMVLSFSNLKTFAGMNLLSPAMRGNALLQEDLNDISSPPIHARWYMREPA
jgi:hypothetical protein